MIHISMCPKVPPLRTPESCGLEEWVEIARAWYAFVYTYYEKSPEELKWIKAQKTWLDAHLPAPFQKGIHLIDPCGGFMGENVYVVDGDIDHTTHVQCGRCHHYATVLRQVDDRHYWWCITCDGPPTRFPQKRNKQKEHK